MRTYRAVTGMGSDRIVIRLIVDRMTDACENITFPCGRRQTVPIAFIVLLNFHFLDKLISCTRFHISVTVGSDCFYRSIDINLG